MIFDKIVRVLVKSDKLEFHLYFNQLEKSSISSKQYLILLEYFPLKKYQILSKNVWFETTLEKFRLNIKIKISPKKIIKNPWNITKGEKFQYLIRQVKIKNI